MEEKEAIEDLLRIFTDPIVLYHHAGAEILPRELANEIQLERMIQRLEAPYPGRVERATDAEALAYLMSASLEVPLNYDWYRIYAHLFGKYVEERKLDIPKDLEEIVAECRELDDYYASLLTDLETWIQEQKNNYYVQERGGRIPGSQATSELQLDFNKLLEEL